MGGSTASSGARATLGAVRELERPTMVVEPGGGMTPSDVAAWIEAQAVQILNVAGNRESGATGIGARAEGFLVKTFRRCLAE